MFIKFTGTERLGWFMRLLFLISGLELLLAISSANAGTIVWNNPGSGIWSDKNNWKPKQIPNFGDTAIITNSGNYTVTLDTSGSVSGLVLGAGDSTTQTISFNSQALTLSGDATVNAGGLMDLSSGTFNGDTNSAGAILNGTLTCSGGALAGKFTVANNSVLNLATSNALSSLLLFTNYGLINWNAEDLHGAAALQIFNFGTWNLPASNTFYGNGTVFNNLGVLNKSAEPGGATVFDSNTVINTTGTITVNRGSLTIQKGTGSGTFYVSPTFISSLSLGSLSGFTFSGNSTFSGDGRPVTFLGVVNVASNAVLNLTSIGTFTITFNGVLFNNYGMVNWFDGHFNAISSSTINNYGTWDAKNNNTIEGESAGTSSFNNFGTVRKSGGSYQNGYYTGFGGVYRLPFNNFGTVEVQTGMVSCVATSSGTVNVASNAFFYSYCTLLNQPSFSGDGMVLGSINGTNAVIHGTLNFDALGSYPSSISGSLTLASNATLNLVDRGFSVIAFNDASVTNFGLVLFTNFGSVNWSAKMLLAKKCNLQVFNYGLWNATTNSVFSGTNGGAAIFNNYGMLCKSAGAGVATFDTNTTVNTTGTVDVQSGELQFYKGLGGGAFNTSINTLLTFLPDPGGNPNFYTLTGSPTFSGSGMVRGVLSGSNAVISGSIALDHATLSGTMTIASNTLVTLVSAGQDVKFYTLLLTNYGNVVWNNVNLAATTSDTQIQNYGLWDAKTNNLFFGTGGTIFNNYGTFRKSGGMLVDNPYYTTLDQNTKFNNFGMMDVLSGALMIYSGINSNSNNIASGAVLYSSGFTFAGDVSFSGLGNVNGGVTGSNAVIHGTMKSGRGRWSGSFTVTTNAVVSFLHPASGQFVDFDALVLTNHGTIVWSNLDFNLYTSESAQIYNFGLWDAQTDNTFHGGSGSVFHNFGIFRKTGGTSVLWAGQTYFDNTTIFNNPGKIDIQVGQLNFGGSMNLAGGTLNFGLNSPTNFGMIFFSSGAGLTGTLSINFNNGFSPVAGDSFPMIVGSTTGNFTAMNLPPLSSGLIWQTNLEPNLFILSVSNAPPFSLISGSVAQTDGAFSFSFEAIVGQTYQVQCTTNLAPANWIDVGAPVTATNNAMVVSDLIGPNQHRFYRVVLQ